MILESPTLWSFGQTTITDIGGGQYHIDSFFDIFTELSLDGGSTWLPSAGSTRIELGPNALQQVVPEPAALGLLGVALLGWRQRR